SSTRRLVPEHGPVRRRLGRLASERERAAWRAPGAFGSPPGPLIPRGPGTPGATVRAPGNDRTITGVMSSCDLRGTAGPSRPVGAKSGVFGTTPLERRRGRWIDSTRAEHGARVGRSRA